MAPIRGRSRTSVDSNSRVMSPSSDDPSYQQKRDRNNLAVKKSREKAKNKTSEMEKQVNAIKEKNSLMEQNIRSLQEELDYLKNRFIACADKTNGVGILSEELETYLIEKGKEDVGAAVQFLVEKVEELNPSRRGQ